MTAHRVVVGYDGSPGAAAALRWAAGEAHRRGAGLHLVHVRQALDADGVPARLATELTESRQRRAEALLVAARAELTATGVRLPVHTEVRAGCCPGEELVRCADTTDLLVIGRCRRDTAEAMLGSVSHRVTAYARCPVAVVPVGSDQPAHPENRVVAVGVSRSSGTALALHAAFAHAQRIGGEVLAVRAWGTLDWAGQVSLYTPDSAERWRLASQHLLDDAVTRCGRDCSAVPVRTRLVRAPVRDALLSAAAGADLLVLAGRLRDDPRAPQLGWTATTLLAEAPCAVEVVSLPQPAPHPPRVKIIQGARHQPQTPAAIR